MKLILFRHGLAMEREESGKLQMDDSMRPLVNKGREKTARIAKILSEEHAKVPLLVSSPLLRAQQTADIISGQIRCERYVECMELVPEAPPQAFARWLKSEAQQASAIIAVGHEPQLSTFASWCLSGDQESYIDLKKSGVICLDIENFEAVGPKAAVLKWILHPKFF